MTDPTPPEQARTDEVERAIKAIERYLEMTEAYLSSDQILGPTDYDLLVGLAKYILAALTDREALKDERERCAKVALLRRDVFGGEPTTRNEKLIVDHIAQAIRDLPGEQM